MVVVKTDTVAVVTTLMLKPSDATSEQLMEHLRNIESYFNNLGNPVPKVIHLEDLSVPRLRW